jgi:hypothetical protein
MGDESKEEKIGGGEENQIGKSEERQIRNETSGLGSEKSGPRCDLIEIMEGMQLVLQTLDQGFMKMIREKAWAMKVQCDISAPKRRAEEHASAMPPGHDRRDDRAIYERTIVPYMGG